MYVYVYMSKHSNITSVKRLLDYILASGHLTYYLYIKYKFRVRNTKNECNNEYINKYMTTKHSVLFCEKHQ